MHSNLGIPDGIELKFRSVNASIPEHILEHVITSNESTNVFSLMDKVLSPVQRRREGNSKASILQMMKPPYDALKDVKSVRS